jgi:tRNA nucleotidyltransferase (CCA-adding enzyme)
MEKQSHFKIPKEVSAVTDALEKVGFESFLIGGCVRDLFIGKTPKDWDVTTNAKPEEIIKLFPETFYENTYGTVGVVTKEEGVDPTLKVIEVTPYRLEADYSDGRRPDHVTWSDKLEDDLKRRDFTINAIALRITDSGEEVVDLFEGRKDLQKGIIRTVGAPHDRFIEDALRILRAVRLATELDFTIESETEKAISEHAHLLANISAERIRDEFSKIIASDRPMWGIELCRKLHILSHIMPELLEGIGATQRGEHIYDVYEHSLHTLEHSAKKKYNFDTRLASLLHDIGKPATRRLDTKRNIYTFHGHDVVGARIAKKILERLKFSNATIDKVGKLIRWHMFFSDTETITLSAVRRMIRNVGVENIWELQNLRICDRIGTGRPKESPYRLRKYRSMIEEALRDPVSVAQLKIDGGVLIKDLGMTPGPAMGFILNALLEEVLDDPEKNNLEYLKEKALALSKLPPGELAKLGVDAKKKREEIEEEEVRKLREKHHVE